MCTPQLMSDMQTAMQQYQQNGGAQMQPSGPMQIGPVGGAAPAMPAQPAGPMSAAPAAPQASQAPQAQAPNNHPIPPQVIAALAARHAAQAHAVPPGLVNHVASSHVGSH